MANAFVRAALNRVLTAGAVFAGIGLVGAGLYLGFGDAVGLLIEDPTDPGAATEQANPVLFLACVVLGVVVWQIGKTYAQVRTTTGSGGGTDVDPELLESIDGRLTKIEAELEETRRGVRRLQPGDHAAFDEDEALDASSPDRGETARGGNAPRRSAAGEATADAGRSPVREGAGGVDFDESDAATDRSAAGDGRSADDGASGSDLPS